MAFTAFTTGEIEAGDSVTQDLWTKVKTDFDDHESRIVSLEGGSATAYPFWLWHCYGYYSDMAPVNTDSRNLGVIEVPFNINIQAARVRIHIAGSSGTTEIDIKKKTGAGAWTSIFSTLPSVASGAGNWAISTNAVLSITSLATGDLLRAELSTAQSGTSGPKDFTIRFEYEKV